MSALEAAGGAEEFFGPPISIYTRAQAIADEVLRDVSAAARGLGFRVQVAVTARVWAECVRVPEAVAGLQTEEGRLHDLLWMTMVGGRGRVNPYRWAVQLVVDNDAAGIDAAEHVGLVAAVEGGDDGQPVLTVMFPGED